MSWHDIINIVQIQFKAQADMSQLHQVSSIKILCLHTKFCLGLEQQARQSPGRDFASNSLWGPIQVDTQSSLKHICYVNRLHNVSIGTEKVWQTQTPNSDRNSKTWTHRFLGKMVDILHKDMLLKENLGLLLQVCSVINIVPTDILTPAISLLFVQSMSQKFV